MFGRRRWRVGRQVAALTVSGALIGSGCTFPGSSRPTPVIVDYSPTVSDVGGLMYLLSNPEVEVIAISLPATGEAGCDLGMDVTLGILAMFDRDDIPVACDPEIPAGAREWPRAFLSAQENLLFGLPESDAPPSTRSDPDLIAEAAAGADRPVVIWAVAPLTNVARALERHPGLANDVDHIVIMGGAVAVNGNVEGTDAEWNFFIDEAAAGTVIAAGVPIVLVPLDATNDVPVPIWYRSVLEDSEQSDAIVYLTKMVRAFPTTTSGFFYLWDELAAAVVVDPGLVVLEDMEVSVVQGGSAGGMTIRGEGGVVIQVAVGVPDPKAFYSEFLGTLAGSPVLLREASPEEEAYFQALRHAFDTAAAEVGPAFDAMFGSDVFDGPAFAEQLAHVLDAFDRAQVAMISLEPPASVAEAHAAYAQALRQTLDDREVILAGVAAAGSMDEVDAIFSKLDITAACRPLMEQAAMLGFSLDDLPC